MKAASIISGYHHIEFYVGSARMAAAWHIRHLGLSFVGYRGPETGCRESCSYVLSGKQVRMVFTSALRPECYAVNEFVLRHGDGVKRIALQVDDVNEAYYRATHSVGIPVRHPEVHRDDQGIVEDAAIRLYHDTELVFFDDRQYKGCFRPGFRADAGRSLSEDRGGELGLQHFDHMVGNVRENEMDRWADYLNRALGFTTTYRFGPGDISTEYSSLLSTVVSSPNGKIKNPINEPYEGRHKSQIDEFIEEYYGTGVQHIAISSRDIVKTVTAMRERGVDFIDVPDSYYEGLKEKLKEREIEENLEDLRRCRILCDFEGEGYLLQIFMRPIFDRPTFFYEVIQRRGAQGFGQGNFKALFEAIERDQQSRGNLVERRNRSASRKTP